MKIKAILCAMLLLASFMVAGHSYAQQAPDSSSASLSVSVLERDGSLAKKSFAARRVQDEITVDLGPGAATPFVMTFTRAELIKARPGPPSTQAASSQIPDTTLYLTVVIPVRSGLETAGDPEKQPGMSNPLEMKGKMPDGRIKVGLNGGSLIIQADRGTLDPGLAAFTTCSEKTNVLLGNLPAHACVAVFAFRFHAAP